MLLCCFLWNIFLDLSLARARFFPASPPEIPRLGCAVSSPAKRFPKSADVCWASQSSSRRRKFYCCHWSVEAHAEESLAYSAFLPFTDINGRENPDISIEKASLTNFFTCWSTVLYQKILLDFVTSIPSNTKRSEQAVSVRYERRVKRSHSSRENTEHDHKWNWNDSRIILCIKQAPHHLLQYK